MQPNANFHPCIIHLYFKFRILISFKKFFFANFIHIYNVLWSFLSMPPPASSECVPLSTSWSLCYLYSYLLMDASRKHSRVDGCKAMHCFPNNPQVATTLKKNDYPSSRSYQLPKSPSQRWASGALLFQAGILIDSALCRASADNLRCYEFMNAKVIWCAEEKISQHSSPSSGSYIVSTSEMFSEPLQWFRVRGNVRGWKVP